MILDDIILSRKHCYRRERTIMDAAADIRCVVAYGEQTQRARSILSLDFRTAFDRLTWLFVSHSQWKWFWWYHGGNPVGPTQEFYLEMWRAWVSIGTSSDWIFGTTGMPVKHDHVCYSTQTLGWNIGRTTDYAHVVKGIRLCVCGRHHDHRDVEAVRDALHTCQSAAGASLKLTKSQALTLGRWNTVHGVNPLDIPYVSTAKNFGIRFHATIAETTCELGPPL